MTRGGRKDTETLSERRCIATGEVQPKRGLIRFAVAPDGSVVPDILEKLPGRGIWVAAERSALETAVARRLFSRGAKRQVTVPEDLVAQVEAGLARRAVDRLSMARKAGLAVCGFEKVKDWLGKEEAAILLQAADGSERGKSKLYKPGGRGSFFDVLTARELGLSFGRDRVIHAALARGGLTDRFREDAIRLSGIRAEDDDGGSGRRKGEETA